MARAHNVVRLEGTLPDGEVWSVTPKFIGNFGPEVSTYADLEAWALAIGNALAGSGVSTALKNAMSSVTALRAVRVEYRDTTGEMVEVAERVLPAAISGTGTPSRPFQCAWVASLRTGRPGASYRGRIYWPYVGGTMLSTTLRIPQSNVADLVAGMSQLLSAIATAAPEDFEMVPAVISKVRGVGTAVTQISGGDVIDTQRRRRDAVAESYETAAYPPA